MVDEATGRVAQRRRTRKAIVDATAVLLSAGVEPSLADIAEAADVSRRTIYMYFPTLDQLVLDATLAATSLDMDSALAAAGGADARARVAAMIGIVADGLGQTLPLGRRLIRLTVDAPPPSDGPKRGYRRIGWIESALQPIRPQLGKRKFDLLVSSLAPLVGWEPFIVLLDVRGLTEPQARRIIVRSALTLVDAFLAETDDAR